MISGEVNTDRNGTTNPILTSSANDAIIIINNNLFSDVRLLLLIFLQSLFISVVIFDLTI